MHGLASVSFDGSLGAGCMMMVASSAYQSKAVLTLLHGLHNSLLRWPRPVLGAGQQHLHSVLHGERISEAAPPMHVSTHPSHTTSLITALITCNGVHGELKHTFFRMAAPPAPSAEGLVLGAVAARSGCRYQRAGQSSLQIGI